MNLTYINALYALIFILLLGSCGTQYGKQNDRSSKESMATNTTEISSTGINNAFKENLCISEHQPYLNSLNSIWDELVKGFNFSEKLNNPRIDKHLFIYDRRQKYFSAMGLRAEKYLFYIKEELIKREMPLELALLPVVESGFDPFAYSHGQAAGMWQFIPGTAKIFHLDSNWWYEGRRDVTASTQAALDYLESLHKIFDNDWLLALAAYNAGWGTVSRAIEKNKKAGKEFDYWSLDLPKETQDYVPKLIALAQVIQNPSKYSIQLNNIANAPFFDQVSSLGQIDLSLVASLADISRDEVYLLNPAYNRWATEPDVNRPLLVPYDQRFIFEKKLAQVPSDMRLTWKRYEVKAGDSLSTIASKNNINTKFLKSINKLSSHKIKIGQTLLIPRPLNELTSYTMSEEQRKLALKHRARSGKKKLTYSVRKNDTLSGIANKYNVNSRALAKWNNIALKDTLREKQNLLIWLGDTADSGNDGERIKQRNIVRNVYYKIKKGDNLSNIAGRFNVTVSDIIHWNPKSRKKYLQPGDTLVLKVKVAG